MDLPCVNQSSPVVSIKGSNAYLGMMGKQGRKFIESVPEGGKTNGDFQHLEDFVKSTGIDLNQAIILIRVGALRFTGKSKKELLWAVHSLLGNKPKSFNQPELFCVDTKQYQLSELIDTKLDDAYHELELLGFPLTLSMFDLLKTTYRGDICTSDLSQHLGKTVKMVGLYVVKKRFIQK